MMKTHFRVGDLVEVRSKEEILQTLDKNGRLDNLPFMPQMFEYCGTRFKVFKSAHKSCDTINFTGGRSMERTVHLETRCDGKAYGGCQAACLLFWKEAWLRHVEQPHSRSANMPSQRGETVVCAEKDIWENTRDLSQSGDEPVYVCQATRALAASKPLSSSNLSQYFTDVASGNVTLIKLIAGLIYPIYKSIMNAGIGVGSPMRWIYDGFQRLTGGPPYPRQQGKIECGSPTPTGILDLQPGEIVRVKSYEEILKTLDKSNKNRGLYFDAEMVPYCGQTVRVLKRVTHIINEKTGKMMHFKSPCIMLEGVICQARYSEGRYFCPRAIYSYWREIWLERVSAPSALSNSTPQLHSETSPEKKRAGSQALSCAE
jgi:hypothetical protein